MIKFTHTIFYVKDIPGALAFYKSAFNIEPRFVHESGEYAELETGSTVIAFASEELGHANLPNGYTPNDINKLPLACEIVFTVDDLESVYQKALQEGAINIAGPSLKPWGQTVAYVRDLNGILIELASPIG